VMERIGCDLARLQRHRARCLHRAAFCRCAREATRPVSGAFFPPSDSSCTAVSLVHSVLCVHAMQCCARTSTVAASSCLCRHRTAVQRAWDCCLLLSLLPWLLVILISFMPTIYMGSFFN
jgi:hypothetical protein